jgi:hypothetical protein
MAASSQRFALAAAVLVAVGACLFVLLREDEPSPRSQDAPDPHDAPHAHDRDQRDERDPFEDRGPGGQEDPFEAALDRFWGRREGSLGQPVPGGTRPQFVDMTEQAGIDFVHSSRGLAAPYLPEMKGAGVLVLDCDGDGWEDLFFGDFSARQVYGQGPTGQPRLYRNLGGLAFEDITAQAGLEGDQSGYGGAAADLDRDGDEDLVLTTFGSIRVYRNRGDCSFEDITASAGTAVEDFHTTATFLDYDLDGVLDLLSTTYGEWTQERADACQRKWADEFAANPHGNPHPPPPTCLPPNRSFLFEGRGDGSFEDVSEPSGIGAGPSRGLGIAILDLDGDLLPDPLIANDKVATLLYRNRGDGSFEEIALPAGVAFGERGMERAGMGVSASYLLDPDQICLSIGFYAREETSLYCQAPDPKGGYHPDRFQDLRHLGELGTTTLGMVTFGLHFLDYDLDGREDLFMVSGHASLSDAEPGTPAEQPSQVYQHLEGGRFAEWVLPPEDALGRPLLGRALTQADLDHDGDQDLVIAQSGGRPLLLRNDTDRGENHALLVELQGTKSNVAGLGAHLHLRCGERRWHHYTSHQASYMSRASPRQHLGLGDCPGPVELRIRWPSGAEDLHPQLPVDRAVRITEGSDRIETLYEF